MKNPFCWDVEGRTLNPKPYKGCWGVEGRAERVCRVIGIGFLGGWRTAC